MAANQAKLEAFEINTQDQKEGQTVTLRSVDVALDILNNLLA